jgi:predicted enzyme related to lactoylglutathione lyase
MAEAKTVVAHKPVWIELASDDAAGSRDFYSKLFGWKVEVDPDPQYGGYGMARIGGKDVAGISPKMMAEAPTAWLMYIASADAADTARKAEGAGGKVVMAAMEVGDQGVMAIVQDPSGGVFGVWQPKKMAGSLVTGKPNAFGFTELNSRGIEKAVPFYKKLFGWSEKKSPMAEGQPGEYTEFLAGGERIAGGMEMNPMVPTEVPSYWQVYFAVDDVDRSHKKAIELGPQEMLAPMEFPGGRFSILSDPQGASFGLLKMHS